MLDLGIDLDVWPWVWLVVAVLFALVELSLLGGSFVLLPFAASAFIASLLGFYGASAEVQWAVFVFGGALLFGGFYRLARRFTDGNPLAPGVGADRLVGLIGIVSVEVAADDAARRGRISVDGEVWGALAADGETLPVGTKVRVTAMKGTRVVVERIGASTET